MHSHYRHKNPHYLTRYRRSFTTERKISFLIALTSLYSHAFLDDNRFPQEAFVSLPILLGFVTEPIKSFSILIAPSRMMSIQFLHELVCFVRITWCCLRDLQIISSCIRTVLRSIKGGVEFRSFLLTKDKVKWKFFMNFIVVSDCGDLIWFKMGRLF